LTEERKGGARGARSTQKCAQRPANIACQERKVSLSVRVISAGRPRRANTRPVYSFRRDLEGVTRRGGTRRGPGPKRKLIAGTHAQHSIQIME